PLDTVVPEEAMGAFRGENPNGTWKLVVKDEAHNDVGTLGGWSLYILGLNQTPFSRVVDIGYGVSLQSIPDGGQALRTLNDSLDHAPISALTLTTFITHPQPSDLLIDLVMPNGVTITVANQRAGGNANAFAGTV